MRLSDGGVFHASTPSQTVLSTAAPAAFGFLGVRPTAAASIQGATLSVPAGATFSIVAGNVSLRSGAVQAPGGRADLISVDSSGVALLNAADPNSPVTLQNFAKLGDVALSQQASINVDGSAGGKVIVRSGTLGLDRSTISASTLGNGAGVGIDILLTGALTSTGSSISSDTLGNGTAGNIGVIAQQVVLDGGGALGFIGIASRSEPVGLGGRAGNVSVQVADALRIVNGARISSTTFGRGPGGGVDIVAAEDILLDAEAAPPTVFTGVSAASNSTGAGGNAGNISIAAQSLQIRGSAQVTSSTAGQGSGGPISVTASSIQLDGRSGPGLSGIVARSESLTAGSRAGDISIKGNNADLSLNVVNGARISSATFGQGAGGNVNIDAREVVLDAQNAPATVFTGVAASSNSRGAGGDAGNISIQTGPSRCSAELRSPPVRRASGMAGKSASPPRTFSSMAVASPVRPGFSAGPMPPGPPEGREMLASTQPRSSTSSTVRASARRPSAREPGGT